MNADDETSAQHTRLEGTADLDAALDRVIARATRRLRLFDRALDRRFDAAHRHELIRAFLLADRANQLQIVLHHVDNIVHDCPRLVSLLRGRNGAISIHQTLADARGVYDPFTVADERHFVHRFHYQDPRGMLGLDDPHDARQFVARFDEILAACGPAVPVTALGL